MTLGLVIVSGPVLTEPFLLSLLFEKKLSNSPTSASVADAVMFLMMQHQTFLVSFSCGIVKISVFFVEVLGKSTLQIYSVPLVLRGKMCQNKCAVLCCLSCTLSLSLDVMHSSLINE